jgi:radical SAM superfamily enzyme YgiQ (UPF0313 family)
MSVVINNLNNKVHSMKSFNIILLADTAVYPDWTRGYGAHRIASHLRSNGFTVLVIDFSIALTFDIWEQICQYAVGENTRMLGFSSTWWPYRKPYENNDYINTSVSLVDWATDVLKKPYDDKDTLTYDVVRGNIQRWIDVVKNKNPKTKIVLGGAKIDWYRDLPVDNFIDGFGETQILDYLNDSRRIWPTYIKHDTTASSRDWGWTTSSTSYTEFDFIKPKEVLTLEIARGCRFKCAFCSFPLIGRKDYASYTKTEDAIYNELLENYNKWGTTTYWIGDDTFNDSIEKLEMFLKVTKRLPFKLNFRAYIRLDIIAMQPEQIQMLYDMGLKSCWIGIETFHPEASKIIGKGMSAEKRKKALYDIQKVWGDDIAIHAGYIIGLPGEDEEFLRAELEWFCQEDNPVNHNPNFLALIINPPGAFEYHPMSDIDRNPEKYGYKIPDMKKHNFWIREDEIGITSAVHAFKLSLEFQKTLSKRRKFIPEKISYALGIRDPVKEYFLPLIDLLKSKDD